MIKKIELLIILSIIFYQLIFFKAQAQDSKENFFQSINQSFNLIKLIKESYQLINLYIDKINEILSNLKAKIEEIDLLLKNRFGISLKEIFQTLGNFIIKILEFIINLIKFLLEKLGLKIGFWKYVS